MGLGVVLSSMLPAVGVDEAHVDSQRDPGPGDASAQRQLLTTDNDDAVAVGRCALSRLVSGGCSRRQWWRKARGVGRPVRTPRSDRRSRVGGGHP